MRESQAAPLAVMGVSWGTGKGSHRDLDRASSQEVKVAFQSLHGAPPGACSEMKGKGCFH